MSGKSDVIREYAGDKIIIQYSPKRCIHVAACVRALPEVFDPDHRPWIDPHKASPEQLTRTVLSCPTGALHFARPDGGEQESAPDCNRITIGAEGPLFVLADIVIRDSSGADVLTDTRAALCRCGASQNKPFCDNAHKKTGFRDETPASPRVVRDDAPSTGELSINPAPNGPLMLSGPVEIIKDSVLIAKTDRAALCRCGVSRVKPFCDGSHVGAGFSAP